MSSLTPPPPGAWSRLRKNPVAIGAMLILSRITFAAIFGPLIYRVDPHPTSRDQYLPPGGEHFFGTDNNGRDAFARVLEGARISLLVGFSGALITLLVGTAYGLVSGYAGG